MTEDFKKGDIITWADRQGVHEDEVSGLVWSHGLHTADGTYLLQPSAQPKLVRRALPRCPLCDDPTTAYPTTNFRWEVFCRCITVKGKNRDEALALWRRICAALKEEK